jgi:hypothetical protein
VDRKHTQSEVRKRDIEIDPDEKPMSDIKIISPPGPKIKTVVPGYHRDDKMVKHPDMGRDLRKEQVIKKKRTLAKGGSVKSPASKRADGIAVKGKTKGRFV